MKREDTFETLFTNPQPTRLGFRRHAETDFDYMNSHADVPVVAARTLIEGWYGHYPVAHREDLARRFRNKNPNQHSGAFWELYLHELFFRMGYCIEVHSAIAGSDARPDFLLLKDGQPVAVVEARLAGVETDEETSAKRRKAELHDALDRVNSPNFFLQIDEVRTASRRPSFRRLTRNVEAWLTTLAPDIPMELFQFERRKSMQFEWDESGWFLRLLVIPKSVGHRGKPGRAVGTSGIETKWLDTRGELRRAVADKARKYGDVELPFIIAINHIGVSCDRTDWTDALFGTSAVNIWFTDDAVHHQEPFRKNDGLWLLDGKARRTNVSAIIGGWAINPWSMGAHRLEVYSHFAPERPFDFQGNLSCWVLSEVTGQLEEQAGRTSAEILGIPHNWPLSWDQAKED